MVPTRWLIFPLVLVQPDANMFLDHVVPLLHQPLALWVAWTAINYHHLPWPILDDGMDDLVHKLPTVVRVEYTESSNHSKNVVLKIEGYFGSRLPHEWKDGMKLGSVVHVVADPLICSIWPTGVYVSCQ